MKNETRVICKFDANRIVSFRLNWWGERPREPRGLTGMAASMSKKCSTYKSSAKMDEVENFVIMAT